VTDGELVTRVALAMGAAPRAEWGISLQTVDGTPLVEHAPERVLNTASVGKVLLLVEVARQFELDPGRRGKVLSRGSALAAADSGLWQHLQTTGLPMVDAAVLVASVSDNWATNVLLAEVGLASIEGLKRDLGLEQTSLLDFVRDERSASDAAQLSVGTAGELAALMARLYRGEVVSTEVARMVVHWLSLNVDLSMVASAFDLDPLAHQRDQALVLINKTGTDHGVRVDTGVLEGPRATLAYCVAANWEAADPLVLGSVIEAMRSIAAAIRRHVETG
jgi:beta-lactamase class A